MDLSWYTRYRSRKNPDLGAVQGTFYIENQPAIPLNDTDTPPNQTQPVPPATRKSPHASDRKYGGISLCVYRAGWGEPYPTLAFKATDPEVLRILVSIGGVEIDHFGLWHDKAGNAELSLWQG